MQTLLVVPGVDVCQVVPVRAVDEDTVVAVHSGDVTDLVSVAVPDDETVIDTVSVDRYLVGARTHEAQALSVHDHFLDIIAGPYDDGVPVARVLHGPLYTEVVTPALGVHHQDGPETLMTGGGTLPRGFEKATAQAGEQHEQD